MKRCRHTALSSVNEVETPDGVMAEDIRDKSAIDHEDVVGLNFIQADGPYVFRRSYRNGLRSHVMAVLLAADVTVETKGMMADGVRWFPRAA